MKYFEPCGYIPREIEPYTQEFKLDEILISAACGDCHRECDSNRGTEEECLMLNVTGWVAILIYHEAIKLMKELAREWVKHSVEKP